MRMVSSVVSNPSHEDAGRQAGDQKVAARKRRRDDVVGGSAVDDDGVRLRIASAAAHVLARSALMLVRSVPVRSLTVKMSAPPSALRSRFSTSSRSMTMLAMLRVKRTRAPLAETSKISLMLAPLKSSVSLPAWPSTVSLPSPGSHWKVSSPAPMKHQIVALLAVDKVVVVAAQQHVISIAAQQRVIARTTIDRDLDQRRQVPSRREGVIAAVGIEHKVFAGADVDRKRSGVDPIEAHPRSIGGRREIFGAVAAVDLDGVDAVAALIEVGVITGVPDHAVVAGFAEDLVVCRRRRSACRCQSPPKRLSAPPLPSSVSFPAPPLSRSLPEPPVSVSLPSSPKILAFGSAPFDFVQREY